MAREKYPIRIPHLPPKSPYAALEPRTAEEISAWLASPDGQAALDEAFAKMGERPHGPPMPTPCCRPGAVYG